MKKMIQETAEVASSASAITHTPGPWEAKPTGFGSGDEHQIFAGNDEIALVYACDGMDEPTWFPGKANASLMAAAPAMLAALREVADFYDTQLFVVTAAIAKAEGKEG